MRAITKAVPIAIVVAAMALPCKADAQIVADIKFDVIAVGFPIIVNVFQIEMHPDGSLDGWLGISESSSQYELIMVGPALAGLDIVSFWVSGREFVRCGSPAFAWTEDGKWHLSGYGLYFLYGLYPRTTALGGFYVFSGVEALSTFE